MFCVSVSVHGVCHCLAIRWVIENPKRRCFFNASVGETGRKHEDEELHAFSP
jgi:hypothetical protein